MIILLNWFGRLILSIAAIAACWGAWYVVYQDSQTRIAQTEKKNPTATMTVEVVPVRYSSLEEHIVLVGGLFPISQTEIRSQVNGYITSLPFNVGDRVEVGSELCTLDTTLQQEAIARAEATLNVAQAQLRAQITEEELAAKNVERQKNLVSGGAGTTSQLEAAAAALKIANAGVDLEKARVQEATSTLERAKLALKDLKLTSPIAGFVAERMMDVGDLAKPDVPILHIVNLDVVQTTVTVVEKNYSKIQKQQRAEVSVDAYPNQVFEGVVKRISPVLDPETRTASIHIEVKNENRLLKPGMYARVTLHSSDTHQGIMVPLSSILEVNKKKIVYTVDEKTKSIQQRLVKLGRSDGYAVEVLEGLTEVDHVVTLGNRLVKPGQTVTVRSAEWSESPLIVSETVGNSEADPPPATLD